MRTGSSLPLGLGDMGVICADLIRAGRNEKNDSDQDREVDSDQTPAWNKKQSQA